MKKIICLLLIAFTFTVTACQNFPLSEEAKGQTASTVSLSSGDINQPTASSASSGSVQDSQNSSDVPSITPEESRMIDTYYSKWEHVQIKLNDSNFVNYYVMIRDKAGEKKADSLMIYLDGSGYESVLGVKNGDKWVKYGNAYGFAKGLFHDLDFMTVDKVNVTTQGDHQEDKSVIDKYTLDSRVDATVLAIDSFIADKSYKNIYIFGISEGGKILPNVYNKLKHKDKITKLASLGGGGLSQYEEFKILAKSDLPMQPGYKESYAQIDEVFKDIENNKESIEKQFFGLTYKRWYGFLKYRAIDDFVKINIPILLIHGVKDTNVPIESSRAVAAEFKKLSKSNLKLIENQNMGHGPESNEQADEVFGALRKWLAE